MDLSILCGEVEAADLMDEFSCLVIRGICDYAHLQEIVATSKAVDVLRGTPDL
jgi:hypothetical protein